MENRATENRPVSPLYEEIRGILGGSWPEDEYDVAESPLSYTDYKSQVSVDTIEPVANGDGEGSAGHGGAAEVAVTDTDFESLRSDDDSDFYVGHDDTMMTDVDDDIYEESDTDTGGDLLATIDRRIMRRSIVEDEVGGAEIAARIDAVVRKAISGGLGSETRTRAKRASTLSVDEMAEGFRAEIAEELSNAFKSVEEELEISSNTEPKVEETAGRTHQPPQMKLIIPDTTFKAPVKELEPPPIPSRSPSRPGTALANRKQLEAPDIFSAPQASVSTTSLAQLKPTVSSMSSHRSSRFFEDLGDQATTTATSVDVSSPLYPKQQESGYSATRQPPRAPAKKQKSGFSCGLFGCWGKSGKSKRSGSNDNARPISTSTMSTMKF